jgi:uncharacterized protein involved in response to NO
MRSRHNPQTSQAGSPEHWIPALVMIAVGAFFLLNNFGILYFRDVLNYWPFVLHTVFAFWPLILIAVGLSMLIGRLAGTHEERS